MLDPAITVVIANLLISGSDPAAAARDGKVYGIATTSSFYGLTANSRGMLIRLIGKLCAGLSGFNSPVPNR